MIIALFSGFGDEILAGAAILVIGWVWGRWRSGKAWKTKQFKNRILLSLNMLEKREDGKYTLKLRTLFERELEEIFHNSKMVEVIKSAIKEVEVGKPLLNLPKDDAWYVLNAVLNKISEQFSSGILYQDMELPVSARWYTFCLTFEIDGAVRMQKPRIMMIARDLLNNFPEDGEIAVESDNHKIRVETLRILKAERDKNPHNFMDIELCLTK